METSINQTQAVEKFTGPVWLRQLFYGAVKNVGMKQFHDGMGPENFS